MSEDTVGSNFSSNEPSLSGDHERARLLAGANPGLSGEQLLLHAVHYLSDADISLRGRAIEVVANGDREVVLRNDEYRLALLVSCERLCGQVEQFEGGRLQRVQLEQDAAALVRLVAEIPGEEVTTMLLGFSRSANASVQSAAVYGLALVGNEAALGRIVEMADNWSQPGKARALEAMRGFGGEVAQTLLMTAVVGARDYMVRGAAAVALGRYEDNEEVVRLLMGVVDSETEQLWIRDSAARSLGQIGDRQAVGTLIRFFESQREYGLDALVAMGGEEALGFLMRCAQDGVEFSMRSKAIRALGELGDARAIGVLMDCVQPHKVDRRLKPMAVRALGKIGDARVADELIGSVFDFGGKEFKREVIWVMGRWKVEAAVPKLTEVFKRQKDDLTLMVTTWALGEIGDRRVVPLLVDWLTRSLSERYPYRVSIEAEVVRALGRLGDEAAVDVLARLVGGEGSSWSGGQLAAVEALAQIGTSRCTELLHQVATVHNNEEVRERARQKLALIRESDDGL